MYIYTMEYYLDIRKKEILLFITQMKLQMKQLDGLLRRWSPRSTSKRGLFT